MPKVKKTRFNQESWDFVAYWYFVKNPEVYKQKELLIHRTFSINKRGSGNPLLHFSIRQLTQFSSKRIPPIWNRLIFPGFWEYRYGLVVELKMNFKSVWIHNSICSFLYWISEKNAKFKKDWFLQPDTISYSTISVIIKISPSFQKKMTEIFRICSRRLSCSCSACSSRFCSNLILLAVTEDRSTFRLSSANFASWKALSSWSCFW